jgi:carbon starvation protein
MPVFAVIVCLVLYTAGYRFYSHWLSQRVFGLRADVPTPAHTHRDGIDYVPTRPAVLFGHHFASITGLSPMLGPAIAVIWGWLPAMLWVVLGALLVGCVHDFGALVVSARSGGKSIGAAAEALIGRRAKSLLHAIIFFGVALAMGVFAYVIATLFTSEYYPQAVWPSLAILTFALVIGSGVRSGRFSLLVAIVPAFVLTLLIVYATRNATPVWDSVSGWTWALLAYAWLASVLPVWSLLQPRDFLNSLLLYLGLGATYLGFFVLRPEFAAPAFDPAPQGAPSLFPFVFIVIACGAASGFHSLVASGTTAKQLDRETHARPIGYGAMIGESLLGLAAVLACTAGFASREAWQGHYANWVLVQDLGAKIGAFIEGSSRFVSALGIPHDIARSLIAVVVVSFALTTLDSATRLLRYNIEEIGESLQFRPLCNRYLSSSIAVAAISFFAFYKIDGKAAGLVLWQLFGSTNQLLAGLALLVVAVYLIKRGRPAWPYLIPMAAMLVTTIIAIGMKLREYAASERWLLFGVGAAILLIALWLIVEAIGALRAPRAERPDPS